MSAISLNNISKPRLLRLFVAAVGLAVACGVAATITAPERGFRTEYFPNEQPGGPAALAGIDPIVSTDVVLRRWYGAVPDQFSARWFGYLNVTSPGRYTFGLTSDDAATLSIDGRRVIDNAGRHAAATLTGDLELPRGSHAVLIEFSQYGGDFAIEWLWGSNPQTLKPVPSWTLSPTRPALWRVSAAHTLDLASIAFASVAVILLLLLAWNGRRAFVRHPRWATLALFVVFALAQTWPVAVDPAHLARHDNRDTMLNEWIVAWVAHQAPRHPAHLFDANIFYPEPHTLAYSEPMIPQGLMAIPLFAAGASPVLAYNLLLIAGFALSGWAMCLVIHSWTGSWSGGVVAGTVFAFNAHLLSRIPHLQAQHAEFLPASLYALDALLKSPRVGRAFRLAMWAFLQATTSVYLLAATFFALLVGVLARPHDWLGSRFAPVMRAVAVSGTIAALALLPVLLPYYHVSHDLGLTRSLADAAMYGATWRDYLSTPSRLMYPWWSYRFFVGTALFPGAVGLALTAVALLRGDAWRDPRARMCLLVGIAGVLLSFGPRMPGYSILYAAIPVLRAIRATARFGYLATFAVAALSGFGVVALRRAVPPRWWPAITVAMVSTAFVESFAAPLGLTRFDGIPPIYSHLPRTATTRVVEFPFFGSNSSHLHASYMLNSTAHWRPIVNGYSGFQPPSFYQHAPVLQQFPNQASMALLHQLGITHVFVHTTQLSPETLAAITAQNDLKLQEVFGSISLYRLESGAR